MKNLYCIIMAGGIGSRFWPESRTDKPKQFLDILGTGQSLLQMTYNRMKKLIAPENIFIVSVEDYYDLILDQLPELGAENIICEPSRNNTAPCVAYATFKIRRANNDSVIVIVPSDHFIGDESAFLEAIDTGASFSVEHEAIVTLGIPPTRPDTGYGYINYINDPNNKVSPVLRFVEKPSLSKAKEYLVTGDYVWNAGIFIGHVNTFHSAYRLLAPEIFRIFEAGNDIYNTPDEKLFIATNYRLSPSISFDYAIAEKAANVFTIPVNCAWSDLGTWASLYDIGEKNDEGIFFTGGFMQHENTSNCIIRSSSDKIIVVKGLEGYIVVDTPKALLIYPKDEEQEIKQVTEVLRQKGMLDYL